MTGAVITARPGRPNGSPVHGRSKYAWDCTASPQLASHQAKLWRASIWEWFEAKRILRPKRPPGGADGLTRCDRDLLAAIVWYAERFPEIRPAVAALAKKAKISPRQADRSKAKLKTLGVIEWDRRCEETDVPGPRGFLKRQLPNLYRLLVPPALRRIMDRTRRSWGPAVDAGVDHEAAAIKANRSAHGDDEIRDGFETRKTREAAREVHHAVSPAVKARLDAQQTRAPSRR